LRCDLSERAVAALESSASGRSERADGGERRAVVQLPGVSCCYASQSLAKILGGRFLLLLRRVGINLIAIHLAGMLTVVLQRKIYERRRL